MTNETLRIFRRSCPVSVLGPYQRAVIWVQGCQFHCPHCIVPESWDPTHGEAISIEECSSWILTHSDIEGITLSGGEPMQQAGVLVHLIDVLRIQRDLGVVCYTGFQLEHLLSTGTLEQHELLQRIDLLIDGPYIEGLHDDLLWRGSRNQRLRVMNSRYEKLMHKLYKTDYSAGLEFTMKTSGSISFAGVPSRPGFRQEFEAQLQKRGVLIQPKT